MSRPDKIPCYPARPVNGGPLPKALKKSGRWAYEPKVNGWRAYLHTPTGTMFNRDGERLTIEHEFKVVLQKFQQNGQPNTYLGMTLANVWYEWLDVEAFSRRHSLGKGSLVLLDAPYAPGDWEHRQQRCYELVETGFAESWAFEHNQPPGNKLLSFAYRYETCEDQTERGLQPDDAICPYKAWPRLQAINKLLKAEVFEGLVAKRVDSLYPHQLRSPDLEFPFWMKHRWAF